MCRRRLTVPSGRSASTSISFPRRSEEHTSELQSQSNLVCRLLLEKKKADLGPLPGLHLHFDQHQVALDVFSRADIIYAHDGADLFELLSDLFDHAVVAHDNERHPR